jgi:hypothetical protein
LPLDYPGAHQKKQPVGNSKKMPAWLFAKKEPQKEHDENLR